MGADITGRVERRTQVQRENRDGVDFSLTAQFGQLISLPPSTNASSPAALGCHHPIKHWSIQRLTRGMIHSPSEACWS